MEYVWDGWNIIRETRVTGLASHVSGLASNVTYNLWGLDIDGTMQGAGGVGGLLAVVRDGETYLPTYDANGNISEYVDSSTGTVAAHYDYSPFGETLVASGTLAASFTHRFSTKPYCQTTGFCEYQMRKYRPDIGRWMSRDPIGEEGGPSLNLWCSNNGFSAFDSLGHIPVKWGLPSELVPEEEFAKRMKRYYGKQCDACCSEGGVNLIITGSSYQLTVFGKAEVNISSICLKGTSSCSCVVNPVIYWWDCYSRKWTSGDAYAKVANPHGWGLLPIPPEVARIPSDPLHVAMIAQVIFESCQNGKLVTKWVYSDNMLIWEWDFMSQAWKSTPDSQPFYEAEAR